MTTHVEPGQTITIGNQDYRVVAGDPNVDHGPTLRPVKILPTAVGTVIQCTRWIYDRTHNNPEYRAMKCANDAWRFACDKTSTYSQENLETKFAKGKFDFEVIA